jgi:hypothetical protein
MNRPVPERSSSAAKPARAAKSGPAAKPEGVDAYIAALPEDRREAIETVRREINRRLPEGYEEGIQYGMIGWYVPHRLFPAGYHCDPKQPLPFASLASQKGYMSLYLMCIYGSDEHRAWFEAAWAKTGKKLDMGKSCVRFKTLDDLALDVIGQAVARVPVDTYVQRYEATLRKARPAGAGKAAAAKTSAAKTSAAKTSGTKKGRA